MGIIGWIVVGFLAGLLAKAITPGTANEPGGFIGTTILGIVGAVVGGFLYGLITHQQNYTNFSLGSILVAAVGAIVVVLIARAVTGKRAV